MNNNKNLSRAICETQHIYKNGKFAIVFYDHVKNIQFEKEYKTRRGAAIAAAKFRNKVTLEYFHCIEH